MKCNICQTELVCVMYDETGKEVYWICKCLIPGTVVAGNLRDYCAQSYKLVTYIQGAQRREQTP